MTMAGMAGENAAIQRFARCRIDEAVAHARASFASDGVRSELYDFELTRFFFTRSGTHPRVKPEDILPSLENAPGAWTRNWAEPVTASDLRLFEARTSF
jgi:hypothetical protein